MMKVYDKLLMPINEVNYLRSENVERYRVIVRYFYQEYQHINYYLYREDIYEMMSQIGIFNDYTLEKCQSDLDSLTAWGNLVASQDSAKVYTIEDFKNKKYRYQLSDYTVEIERMALTLENLELESAALEPTLLERIKNQIILFTVIKDSEDSEVASWWRSLSNDFKLLNRNYQDYLKTLNTAKAEEMMKSKEFLIFKDKLIVYLRTFVKSLQENSMILQQHLTTISEQEIISVLNKVVAYELSIPRLDNNISGDELYLSLGGTWQSIYQWFVGDNDRNEVTRLANVTNEIIRKITRYAQQIGELHNLGANRKEEYRQIARIFGKCLSLNEAHCLSASVFGVEHCLHLKNLKDPRSESIDSLVYQDNSNEIALESRSRINRAKSPRLPSPDYQQERLEQARKIKVEQARRNQILNDFIKQGTIRFSQLPILDSYSRKLLLSWLSKALGNKDLRAKSENGISYQVVKENDEMCVVKCDDGNLEMPSYQIIFDEVK